MVSLGHLLFKIMSNTNNEMLTEGKEIVIFKRLAEVVSVCNGIALIKFAGSGELVTVPANIFIAKPFL